MNKFLVQHVIVSHKEEDGTPRHMSLHIPIDGKIRVHTLMPSSPMYIQILAKLTRGEAIYIEADYVTLECPIYYALITDKDK